MTCFGKKVLSLGRESKRSSETSYACERGLSHELNNRLDCHAIARNDEKNLCHPELGATHVAHCDNVGDICNDYLKSFSGSINVDLEPLTRISNAHIHSQGTAPSAQSTDRVTRIASALRFPLSHRRGEGKEGSVGDMKENIFSNKVYSLFTTHHSLIHNDMNFSLLTKSSFWKIKRNYPW